MSAQRLLIPTLRALLIAFALFEAVDIRLYAVRTYGRVIHEFDPWFNFRAAEYMVAHGWGAFQAWYDHEVWYPLGRHVGSTTYPGLQLTAWGVHSALAAVGRPASLNDVCVFLPAGFGALAAGFTGLLAWEVTRKPNAAALATAIMAIHPGHLMRSIAGGFDNESIAVAAMVSTFYLWVRALRSDASWPAALLCGVSYSYMVAAWGGYVFVLNMIGIHAAALVLVGRYSARLWRAYSLWWLVGTAGAVFGPARYLVGWQPFQSLEQLGPTAVFAALQLWQLSEVMADRRRLDATETLKLRLRLFGYAAAAAAVAVAVVLPEGFIGPMSARVRSLFIKHTKTGNPLVDSVAEHQATPPMLYWHYFHFTLFVMPLGLGTAFFGKSDAKLFLIVYTIVGFYFSAKMVRLLLLISPATSVCAAACLDSLIAFNIEALTADDQPPVEGEEEEAEQPRAISPPPQQPPQPPQQQPQPQPQQEQGRAALGKKAQARLDAQARVEAGGRRRKQAPPPPAAAAAAGRGGSPDGDGEHGESGGPSLWDEVEGLYTESASLRRSVGMALLSVVGFGAIRFVPHSFSIARRISEPHIMVRARHHNGTYSVYDDFREAYWWLRDETPRDSRVMAWWDYGYQISGVANRTTLADGNTWNHEHIALLGKCLVSSEEASHAITRHLADYVLLWTTRHNGMAADDLAKSPHMARIAGSVYPDINAQAFYLGKDGTPSKMMEESLLYRLHGWGLDEKIAPLQHFEEVYTTSHKMVRIYKVRDVSAESKAWRQQHGPGYPPALEEVLKTSKAFQQIHGL